MRIENVFCEDCGVSHYVEVVQREPVKGLIIKTKCHGRDFLPVQSNPAIKTEGFYIKHHLRGYNIIKKSTNQPRAKMPTTFKQERKIPQPVEPMKRVCLAELSMTVRGQFVTIKVFNDATPDKFYEFFYQITDSPKMIKPRTLGMGKPVHIEDIPNIYKIEGKVNMVFHNRKEYEKLLTIDPHSMEVILNKNNSVSSATGRR